MFQLLAARYMDARYARRRSPRRCGVSADAIRRIAAELADGVRANQSCSIAVDRMGRGRHDKMLGRPVAMHAMRGVSAHSNGFHTCRAIHLLQVLLGAIDSPGGWRFKAPFPQPIPPAQSPQARAVAPTRRLAAAARLSERARGFVG